MRIALLSSNFYEPVMQDGIARGLLNLGHHVEHWRPHSQVDLILVFQQVPHRLDYVYPKFPSGNTPIALIDAAEFGWKTRLPENAREWANSFTPAAMGHDTKNREQQERLRQWLEGKSFPYFLREMHKSVEYPASYHPIDYPLYHHSEDHNSPNRENYLARDLELFCWWGHSHPWRQNIEEALRKAHRQAEIGNRWSDQNLDQSYYFARMRAAKCTVSYDGYGSSSFRATEALCRTLLLQGPLWIRTRAPLVDGVTCRMYDVQNEGEEFTGTNIADVMADALADPDGSFEIYERGWHHVHEQLSEAATARYVLETVEAHDWSQPTPLAV